MVTYEEWIKKLREDAASFRRKANQCRMNQRLRSSQAARLDNLAQLEVLIADQIQEQSGGIADGVILLDFKAQELAGRIGKGVHVETLINYLKDLSLGVTYHLSDYKLKK